MKMLTNLVISFCVLLIAAAARADGKPFCEQPMKRWRFIAKGEVCLSGFRTVAYHGGRKYVSEPSRAVAVPDDGEFTIFDMPRCDDPPPEVCGYSNIQGCGYPEMKPEPPLPQRQVQPSKVTVKSASIWQKTMKIAGRIGNFMMLVFVTMLISFVMGLCGLLVGFTVSDIIAQFKR